MFGFGKKTWKDEHKWLEEASKRIIREYHTFESLTIFLFFYTFYKKNAPSGNLIKDQIIFNSIQVFHEEILQKWLKNNNADWPSGKNDFVNGFIFICYKNRLNVMNALWSYKNIYPKGSKTEKWLKSNNTDSTNLENFKKRQLGILENISTIMQSYYNVALIIRDISATEINKIHPVLTQELKIIEDGVNFIEFYIREMYQKEVIEDFEMMKKITKYHLFSQINDPDRYRSINLI